MTARRTTDLQIRGVPVALRDRLRQRARRKGVSMSQYVVEKLAEDLSLPTTDEWLEKVAALPAATLGADFDAAALIQGEDEARTEELTRRSRSSSTRRRRSTS